MDFSKFCNICFKEENVLNISTEENTALLNTFITLIGQPEVVHENGVYFCSCCCNKLEDINKFRDMCITNFINFRKSCYDLERKLKNSNDSDINEKIKIFIDSQVREQNSCVENEKFYRSTERENNEIQLEQIFIKEEPDDMLSEIESTVDYNIHNQMDCEPKNIKSEEFEKKYILESEIDLGTCSYHEDEPNLLTANENINSNNISVPLQNVSNEEMITETSPVMPRTRGKNRNGETQHHVCNICNKSFQKLHNLMKHRLVHTGEKLYKCNLCNKKFNSSSHLKKHQCQYTGEKPYECDTCEKSFNDLTNLNKHRLTHIGNKPRRCNVCKKTFNKSSYLKIHQLFHTGEKPHECDICKKTFAVVSSLNRHRLIHNGGKPHECDICHKSFNALSVLNRHRLIHTREKSHKCNLCKKTFYKSSYLKIHRRVHTGEKPHACDICKKTFAVTSNLYRHRLIHTRSRDSS